MFLMLQLDASMQTPSEGGCLELPGLSRKASRVEGPAAAPPPVTLSRTRRFLDLATSTLDADCGGIALLSGETDLLEHVGTALPDEVLDSVDTSAWLRELARFLGLQEGATRCRLAGTAPFSPPPRVTPSDAFLGTTFSGAEGGL